MKIHDVYDFDAEKASRELLRVGFTAVDDIGGSLIDCARDELLEALVHAGDGIDMTMNEIDTSWGPVFVFRNPAKASISMAKAFVLAQRPA